MHCFISRDNRSNDITAHYFIILPNNCNQTRNISSPLYGLHVRRLASAVHIAREDLHPPQRADRHLRQHHHGGGVGTANAANVREREGGAGQLRLREGALSGGLLVW